MVCPKAKIFIDFHGSVIAEHVADRYWDINRFIQFARKEQVAWRDIYWKIWAHLQKYECSECLSTFIGAELNHCSYHPNPPDFQYGSNVGFYPCCKQKTLRFDTSIKKQGCMASIHKITEKTDGEEEKV
jgi:hypothetical protein